MTFCFLVVSTGFLGKSKSVPEGPQDYVNRHQPAVEPAALQSAVDRAE
jgi:hypothetical protein